MKRQLQPFARSYYAVLIGLQAMFTCFVLWGSAAVSATATGGLTWHGAELFRPERELSIYVLSVIGTMLLGAAMARRLPAAAAIQEDSCTNAWQCGIATLGAFCFILLCLLIPGQIPAASPLRGVFGLLLFGGLAVIWSFVAFLVRREIPAWFRTAWNDCARQIWPLATSEANSPFGVGDIAVLVLLVLLVYIPNLATFAGFDFESERLHHWDFFVMGPALGYLRGGRLGSQVYSQYGMGFPLAVGLLAKWIPVTYPNVMRMAVLAACLYYSVLYAFLRRLLNDWKWACFGVLLAVDIQLFQGVDTHQVLWQYPSSTIMRSPCDILVFCALLWDARSPKRLPMVFASLCVGAALVFETDTGIYLALALACYLGLTRWNRSAFRLPSLAAGLATCAAPGAAVLVLGLELAARGSAFTGAFLSGWLEVFRVYPSGIGMLPMTMFADGLLLAFVVIGIYLAVACYYVGQWRCGRIERRGAMLACLAIYGLCYLCQYIGRSHPFNLFHSSIPVVILILVGMRTCAARILGPALHSAGQRSPALSARQNAAPGLLICCVLIHIATLHGFQDYPNVFHPQWERAHVAAAGPEFDGTGVQVPVSLMGTENDFSAVTSDARRLFQEGSSVLFLVTNDPIYYMASETPSKYRYSPLFQCLLTKSLQATFERQFVQDHIDYVFVPPIERNEMNAAQAWDIRESLIRIVKANYRLDHRCGSFEVWRHL